MVDFLELEKMLQETSKKVREAVDVSVGIKVRCKDSNDQVTKLWEEFLKDFIGYVKEKGRDTGHNLMAGISFNRIMK